MLTKQDITFDEYDLSEAGERLLLIINPFAGKGINKWKVNKLIKIFKDKNFEFIILHETGKNKMLLIIIA